MGRGLPHSSSEIVKTTVTLPYDLFRKADATARSLRISRSQLYATAISEFLERKRTGAITTRLNDVYSRGAAKVDPVLHRAQLRSIDNHSW